MTEPLVFDQKRASHRVHLAFEPEHLAVRYEDDQTTNSFDQPYDDIAFDATELKEKKGAARAAAIFFLGFAVFGLVNYYFGGFAFSLSPVGAAIQLALAGLFEFAYRKTQVTFTIFDASRGGILIIQDDKHDEIVAELTKRRNEQVEARFGVVDTDNDPDAERAKFKWLLDHEVIDQHRYEEAMEEIERGDVAALPAPTIPTPPSGTVH